MPSTLAEAAGGDPDARHGGLAAVQPLAQEGTAARGADAADAA